MSNKTFNDLKQIISLLINTTLQRFYKFSHNEQTMILFFSFFILSLLLTGGIFSSFILTGAAYGIHKMQHRL